MSLDLSHVWQPDPTRRSKLARFRGVIKLSAKQLRHRLLESLLIVLGIALGVGVLTGMESLLRFLVTMENEALVSQPEVSAVSVAPRTFDMTELYQSDGVPAIRLVGGLDDPVQLTMEHLLWARNEVSGVGMVALVQGNVWGSQVVAINGEPWQTFAGSAAEVRSTPSLLIEGKTPDEQSFRNRTMVAGRWFTWDEFMDASPVLVLEEKGVEVLFPGREPHEVIGYSITESRWSVTGESTEWQIVGVVAQVEQPEWMGAFMMEDSDSAQTYVPETSLVPSRPMSEIQVRQMYFMPKEGVSPDELASEMELFFAHRLGPDRVEVTNPATFLKELNEQRIKTSLTLMGLAALALFVAAINILNLLTARVIKRRRMAAMSVALGAERRSLFSRVLTEALLLGLTGSVIGMLPAWGVVTIFRLFFSSEMAFFGGPNPFDSMGLAPIDALIGLLVGVGVSLLFGLYPAYLSASTDPADGLRRE